MSLMEMSISNERLEGRKQKEESKARDKNNLLACGEANANWKNQTYVCEYNPQIIIKSHFIDEETDLNFCAVCSKNFKTR